MNIVFKAKLTNLLFVLLCCLSFQSYAQDEIVASQSLEELEKRVQEILKNNDIPAIGIAMVAGDSIVLAKSYGKANIKNNIDATPETMFRIGSTSKMFVSLSILKLQEEGKVSLDDKVYDLVPEIAFKNKWRETNPILVSHLLEHTTGWDDLHLIEYAYQSPDSMTLKHGLDYHTDSRISRWVPGTRMSYSNSGPPVAAYIVEKITGMSFEDYVQETFFDPMGMETMTYFNDDNYKKYGATLYNGDDEEDAYWYIVQRPSGSINASPKDMARMLTFFVNRGVVDSTRLISTASLDRMETTKTTAGAKEGLTQAYGLSNFISPYKSFTYHGHHGSVGSGICTMAYYPEGNVGFSAIINNSKRGVLVDSIMPLIQAYQTRDLIPHIPPKSAISIDLSDITGYYTTLNPRSEMTHFLNRMSVITKLEQHGDTLIATPLLGGDSKKYLPQSKSQFTDIKTGNIALVAYNDPIAGQSITEGWNTAEKESNIQVFGKLSLAILWLLFMAFSILAGLFWIVRLLMKKIKGRPNVWVRFLPILTTLSILGAVLLLIANQPVTSADMDVFSTLNIVSVSIMLLTILFAVFSIVSLIYIIKTRRQVQSKHVYRFSLILALLHLCVSGYFLAYGVIGFQTWA